MRTVHAIGRLGIWIANAALFALCCGPHGAVAPTLVAEWLAAAPEHGAAADGRRPRARRAPGRDRQAILDRNLFKVVDAAAREAGEAAPVTEEELEATQAAAQAARHRRRGRPAKRSWAAVDDQQNHQQHRACAWTSVCSDKA